MNLSLFLFLIGILGFILNRKNLLLLIISIEIMLLAVTLLIIISSFNFDDNIGQTFAIYIITIAGAESVIGLSILVAYYRLNLLLINIKSYIKINLGNFLLDSKLLNLDSSNHNFLKDFKLDSLTLQPKGDSQNYSSIPPVYYFSKSLLSLLYLNKQNLHKFRNYSSWSFMSKIEREASYINQVSLSIQVSNNKLIKLESNLSPNYCKSIVVYGKSQGSTLGYRLSQTSLNGIFLNQEQKEIIIGILLGDGYIQKKSENGNAMIQFNQGYIHLKYILYIAQSFSPIMTHFPLLIKARDGSFYLKLSTRSLKCLNPIYDLFITEKKKTIRSELEKHLSPRSLAYWAMDDGSLSESGFYFNTMSFSLEENILLQKMLNRKFNLESNIHKHKDKYKIYIRASSMAMFRFIVYPYLLESFYYKLAHKLIKTSTKKLVNKPK